MTRVDVLKAEEVEQEWRQDCYVDKIESWHDWKNIEDKFEENIEDKTRGKFGVKFGDKIEERLKTTLRTRL